MIIPTGLNISFSTVIDGIRQINILREEASRFIAQRFEIIASHTKRLIDEYQEPVLNTSKKILHITGIVIKVAIGVLFALSMSSLFFAGAVYGYLDPKGSRSLITRLTDDWKKSPVQIKIALAVFGTLAWPGTLALGAFLMGTHTAHAIQDQPSSHLG